MVIGVEVGLLPAEEGCYLNILWCIRVSWYICFNFLTILFNVGYVGFLIVFCLFLVLASPICAVELFPKHTDYLDGGGNMTTEEDNFRIVLWCLSTEENS